MSDGMKTEYPDRKTGPGSCFAEGCRFYGDAESFTIEDQGIGIAKEDLPRIFEKGYTGYNGHNEKKSTGLGLYLVKKAADMLSCEVLFSSEVGKGTKVKVLFGKK